MSYCVHCGVKLASYEKKCPLCGTPVIDPNKNKTEDLPRYVDKIEMNDKNLNRHFVTVLLTTVLAIPALVVILIDLAINHGLSWSLLVCGGEICLWFVFVYPFRYYQKHRFMYAIIDAVAFIAYVFLIALMTNGINWYLQIALPIMILSGLYFAYNIHITNREKYSRILTLGVYLMSTAILLCGIDLSIHHAITGKFDLSWALWPGIPLFFFGLFFTVASTNRTVSEWLRKKLFI